MTFLLSPFFAMFGQRNDELSLPLSRARVQPMGRIDPPTNVVPFYRGIEANINGVTLEQILDWDERRLESTHNYIQWLFPSVSASQFNQTSPLLKANDIQAFHQEPILRKNLIRSFCKMLSFYGLQMNDITLQIQRAPNSAVRQAVWLTPGNHNYWRIARILRCLTLLGLKSHAQAFHAIVMDISRNEGVGKVSAKNRSEWASAAQ